MALQVFTGSFSAGKVGTGSQVVRPAGLSFTPTCVIFFADGLNYIAGPDTWNAGVSRILGFTDGTTSACCVQAIADGASTSACNSTFYDHPIVFQSSAGTILAQGELTSLDSGGWTLNWTTTDNNLRSVAFIALAGVSAKVLTWSGTGSSPQSVTGVGFKPTAAIHLSQGSGGQWNLGVADGAGNQWSIATISRDGQAAADTYRYMVADKCLSRIAGNGGSINAEASFSSMDSDGFTVTWPTTSTITMRSLFLGGVVVRAGTFSKSTSTSTPVSQTVSGLGMKPSAIFLASAMQTSSASINAHNRFGFGAFHGAGSGAHAFVCQDEDGADPTNADSVWYTGKPFVVNNDNGTTPDAIADDSDSSVADDQFTLDWETNNAVATVIGYLAIGAQEKAAATATVTVTAHEPTPEVDVEKAAATAVVTVTVGAPSPIESVDKAAATATVVVTAHGPTSIESVDKSAATATVTVTAGAPAVDESQRVDAATATVTVSAGAPVASIGKVAAFATVVVNALAPVAAIEKLGATATVIVRALAPTVIAMLAFAPGRRPQPGAARFFARVIGSGRVASTKIGKGRVWRPPPGAGR